MARAATLSLGGRRRNVAGGTLAGMHTVAAFTPRSKIKIVGRSAMYKL